MKIFKNNKKLILGIILGLIASSTIVYAATILYASSEASFNNTNSHLKNSNNEITLQEALDALYDEANSYGCPTGRNRVWGASGTYKCAHKSYAMTSGYTCVRASWLHKEKCTQTSDYCYADGYYTSGSMGTNMITYGNLGTAGTDLVTGDALDCDVNGNGYIDVDEEGYSTERFYYVSPRWTPGTDVSASAFDDSTAVLIYYSNTYDGEISSKAVAYATKADIQTAYPSETISNYDNCHGPVTAIKHLPKTKTNGGTWNDYIKKNNGESKRAIISCNNGNCTTASTSTAGGSLPQDFSYEGYAGRLLTMPEIKKAGCDTLSGKTSLETIGALKACNFLMEGTQYADNKKSLSSPWLENPYTSGRSFAWYAYEYDRNVGYGHHNSDAKRNGSRPVIEVPMSQILK